MKRIDIKQICLEVSKKQKIPVKDVEEMVDLFFQKIKYYIQLPAMPKITITGFFRFEKDVNEIFKRIEAIKHSFVLRDVSQEFVDIMVEHFKNALTGIKNLEKHEQRFRKKQDLYRAKKSRSNT